MAGPGCSCVPQGARLQWAQRKLAAAVRARYRLAQHRLSPCCCRRTLLLPHPAHARATRLWRRPPCHGGRPLLPLPRASRGQA